MRLVKGNLFDTDARTLVNAVNCVGVMGKGIAEQFKNRYPLMYADYRRRCREGGVIPGIPYHYQNQSGASIINFPTKLHWQQKSQYDYIERGIDYFVKRYEQWGIESVAFPALGCGLGGLIWTRVRDIMIGGLEKVNIPVEIYTPE